MEAAGIGRQDTVGIRKGKRLTGIRKAGYRGDTEGEETHWDTEGGWKMGRDYYGTCGQAFAG